MKKLATNFFFILFVGLGLVGNTFAQAPEGIIYQAEARDVNGNPIRNQTLDVLIKIIQDDAFGPVVWEGLHEVTTSNFGIFVLVIGQGTNNGGTIFEDIDWGNHSHFLNVQVKKKNTSTWIDMGTQQLLSVPYALHSKTAETVITETDPLFNEWDKSTGISITESQISDLDHFTTADETDPSVPSGTQTGQMQYWNGSAWVTVAAGNEGQVLTFTGGVPTWTTTGDVGELIIAVNFEGAGSVTGEGVYMEGEEVALTATANEGWEFVNWTDGDDAEISKLADFTYTMPAYDVTLTANFEEEEVWPIDTVTMVLDVTNPTTGKIWMDRNLGASQVATSRTDAASYGDLYQWGRGTDGHEKRTSGTTSTLSSSDTPGHGNFITAGSPSDWRSPQNNNLWQGVSGTNNPCPSGYRLPTEAEWEAERTSWSNNNSYGAFASPLKLPVAGNRNYSSSLLGDVGYNGLYWSSTVVYSLSRILTFGNSDAVMYYFVRAYGGSVRCLKD